MRPGLKYAQELLIMDTSFLPSRCVTAFPVVRKQLVRTPVKPLQKRVLLSYYVPEDKENMNARVFFFGMTASNIVDRMEYLQLVIVSSS